MTVHALDGQSAEIEIAFFLLDPGPKPTVFDCSRSDPSPCPSPNPSPNPDPSPNPEALALTLPLPLTSFDGFCPKDAYSVGYRNALSP